MSRPAGAIRRLRSDKRGAAAVMTALATSSLLGVVGLTVEVGNWYLMHRSMQIAADAAALAGSVTLDATGSSASAVATAQSVATRNGFVDGVNGATVTVAPDPSSGNVAVTVQRASTAQLLQAAGFGDSTKTIVAQAVAQVVNAGAPPCVLTMSGSVAIGNNVDVTAGDCALASNSTAANAFRVGSGGSVANGSGHITAANIVTHGGCQGCNEAMGTKLTLTRSPTPSTYAPPLVNAYAALNNWSPPASVVSPSLCGAFPTQNNALRPLAVGCYTSFEVKNSSPVDLKPGVYYIRGGDLLVQGDLTCSTCTDSRGVSIVLVGAGAAAPGAVNITSQAKIDLNASLQPSQSALDGVLIYRHNPGGTPSTTANGDISILGGGNVRLDGAVVGPTSSLTMGGNGATDPASCNVLVVASAELRGTSNLSVAGCGRYGTMTSVPRMARLVQ